VPTRRVAAACIVSLAAAFVIDLLTSQLFVAAILLDVPIVLSMLGGSRRLTYVMVAIALGANGLAGYANGVRDHYTWDVTGLGDRTLAALSVILVGYLVTLVQDSAERAGRAASQEARAHREAQIASTVEPIRKLLSIALVQRAIASGAVTLLGASEARFVLPRPRKETLVARAGSDAVESEEVTLAPEAASLVQRAAEEDDVVAVDGTDPLGRMLLDRYATPVLLALPLAEPDERFGVLLVSIPDAAAPDLLQTARAFARSAAGALAHARLFDQLAERNDALAERNAVIRDLVYAVSHDLRTPLAALGMTLKQARAGTYGTLPEPYLPIVDGSVVAIDDLQRFVETLLLVARIESGERHLQSDVVQLVEVARQIGSELDALARSREVRLVVDERADARTIADRGDIRRAIVNLVANALEHTPRGGTVTIAVEASGRDTIVRVIDDGYGVSESVRSRLFHRFSSGDDRRGAGSGLGLYIVRRVAEETGGSVAYEPNVPHGSIFTVRLPAARPA
jgi:signal transduction histidine kinase